MSVYNEVQAALDAKLALIADLPRIVNENDVQTKNQNFVEGVLEEKYVRTTLIPRDTQDVSIGVGGCDNFGGLFQVDIFTPTGNGIAESNYWVDEIITSFQKSIPINTTSYSVRILNYSRTPGITSTNWHQVGVAIEWYVIKKR